MIAKVRKRHLEGRTEALVKMHGFFEKEYILLSLNQATVVNNPGFSLSSLPFFLSLPLSFPSSCFLPSFLSLKQHPPHFYSDAVQQS